MSSLQLFAPGVRFYVKLPDDTGVRRLTFLNKKYDTVKSVDPITHEVTGDFSIAHYSDCDLVQTQPEQLQKHLF